MHFLDLSWLADRYFIEEWTEVPYFYAIVQYLFPPPALMIFIIFLTFAAQTVNLETTQPFVDLLVIRVPEAWSLAFTLLFQLSFCYSSPF